MSAMRENTDVTTSGEMQNGSNSESRKFDSNCKAITMIDFNDQIASNHNDQISPDVDK